MPLTSDAYDRSVLDQDGLISLAKATAELAWGRVATKAVAGSEFWELGRIVRERSRRTERETSGTYHFWGNVSGDLVGLKPDGRLVEVRYTQSAGSDTVPPPMELGAFETRWEEGPFEKAWHFELLDEANLGEPREEIRERESGRIHEELWDMSFVAIVEQRGRGLERALQELAGSAREAINAGHTVPHGTIEPLTQGIYVHNNGEFSQYLRFYDDGRVIGVSTSGTPAQIAGWFNWEHENINKGNATKVGNHIEFMTRSNAGALAYHGTLTSPAQLLLDSYSHINGYTTTASVFDFVAVELPS